MKSFFLIATALVLTIFIISCENDKVTCVDCISLLPGAEFTVVESLVTSTELIVKGMITNNSGLVYNSPWNIDAEFYADSTYVLKLGVATSTKDYSLAPGEITLWQLIFSSDLIIESDYPDFAIKNLRAYVEE